MKYAPLKILLLLTLLLTLATSCKNYVSDTYYHFDESRWQMYDTLYFDFRIDDTFADYTVKFNIRANDEYRYRNMYLFTSTIFPNDVVKIDTLQFILSDETGKSYGKHISGTNELEFLMNPNMKFTQQGLYKFNVEHGMRDYWLEGIESIGFVITKNR